MHIAAQKKYDAVIARFNCSKRVSGNIEIVLDFTVINLQFAARKSLWFSIEIVNIGEKSGCCIGRATIVMKFVIIIVVVHG